MATAQARPVQQARAPELQLTLPECTHVGVLCTPAVPPLCAAAVHSLHAMRLPPPPPHVSGLRLPPQQLGSSPAAAPAAGSAGAAPPHLQVPPPGAAGCASRQAPPAERPRAPLPPLPPQRAGARTQPAVGRAGVPGTGGTAPCCRRVWPQRLPLCRRCWPPKHYSSMSGRSHGHRGLQGRQ